MPLRPMDRIGPAAPIDVLYEQFEALVDHGIKHNANVECSECRRFLEVQDVLMRPFAEKIPTWLRVRKARQKKATAKAG